MRPFNPDHLVNFECFYDRYRPDNTNPTDFCGTKRYLTPEETLGVALKELYQTKNILISRVPEIQITGLKNTRSIMGISYGGTVLMREDLGENNPFHLSTAIHEFAHELLHVPFNAGRSVHDIVLNRMGGFIAGRKRQECEAESVTKFTMWRLGIDWPKMTPYDTWDDITFSSEQETTVISMILNQYYDVASRHIVVPDYYVLTKPADPRYEKVDGTCLWCTHRMAHLDCKRL
jgi:hypothetical protein